MDALDRVAKPVRTVRRKRTAHRDGRWQGKVRHCMLAQCLTVAAVRSMACIMEDLQRYTLPGLRHADERG